jgi:hypothetical protein
VRDGTEEAEGEMEELWCDQLDDRSLGLEVAFDPSQGLLLIARKLDGEEGADAHLGLGF